jgi:UPF0176 protein
MPNFLTVGFYKFVALPDFAELKAPLFEVCERHQIKGTILLAEEGINGAIAGEPAKVEAVLAFLRADPRLADLESKAALSEKLPFYRLKVRLKREIVTLGVPGINPSQGVGEYVKPQDWNQLLDDPDLVLIDVRNDYEVAIGTFAGAINPQIKSFSELPEWVQETATLRNKPKVAMFCTGGIRCEKSTAFLKRQGFEQVYHLEGGILKYLEQVPATESRWQGECFVFDERISVIHGLEPGNYELCRACRQPIGAEDKISELFVTGISCPHCHGSKTDAQLKGCAERQRQVELAKRRDQTHIGAHFNPQQIDPSRGEN